MGLGPSLDIAGYHFTGYRKTDLCCAAHTKFSESMRSFQFRIRCFDPGTNLIPVLPFFRLLNGIHLIPQTDFGGDLQAKIPDGVTRRAAAITMIGSSHWTMIEHFT